MSDSEKLTYHILQHSRSIKRDSNGAAIEKNAPNKFTDQINSALNKKSRLSSAESVNYISLDELPEQSNQAKEKTGRINKSGDHLYRLLKSEKEKDFLETLKRGSSKVIDNTAQNGSSSHAQLNNGQITEIKSSVHLLDQPTIAPPINVTQIHSENAVIASLSKQEKVRVLMERMRTNHTELNRLEQQRATEVAEQRDRDNVQFKRTIGGRSKSVSASSIQRQTLQRPHFKMSWQHNAQKGKKVIATNSEQKVVDHNRQWDSMAKVLMLNANSDNEESHSNAMANENVENVDDYLIWHQSRQLAQIKNSVTSLLFERNEFGLLEICPLAMSKLKAMKTQQNDQNNYPKGSVCMPCGHENPADCFDTAAQNMMCQSGQKTCMINGKKPSHYFSTEIKELYGSMIHSGKNSCQTITASHLLQEIRDTKTNDRLKNSNNFDWTRFVTYYNEKPGKAIAIAPPELFSVSFPSAPNPFEIGQKLEAIDPHNSGLFCVATITEKCGYRIKIQFDGYSAAYAFWVNANTNEIFPAGFCSKTGRELEYPGQKKRPMGFSWDEYLKQTKAKVAHRACFPHLSTARTNLNPFKIGFKLEADDRKGTQKICVATIGDVIDSRILISFDGFDDSFNYWTDITSPYIHAANWHQENGFSITTPPNWRNAVFNWFSYLRLNRAEAISKDAFHTRNPRSFEVGMALEVVDRKNPCLIRPAVITDIYEYDIKVLYIGWPEEYAYWLPDDSMDIYPPGWCKRTNHPVEFPLDDIYRITVHSCGIRGCMGLGNGKRLEANTHSHANECPYYMANWKIENNSMLPSRIERKKSVNNWFNTGAGPCRTRMTNNPSLDKASVSLQPLLNPIELFSMSSKDVEMFRRLQVSSNFLLEQRGKLSKIHDQWIDRTDLSKQVVVAASLKNPLHWTKEEVAEFVSKLKNCSMLDSVFMEHEIDGLAFLSLRQTDLTNIMGLSLGSAIKIYNRIVALRAECNSRYINYDSE